MRKYIYILALSVPLVFTSSCSFFEKKQSSEKTPGRASTAHQNIALEQARPLTISQNNYGGKVLELSNGENWEVYKKGRVHSGGWLSGTLTIKKQKDYRRDGKLFYRYIIFNSATNDSVWARPLPDSD